MLDKVQQSASPSLNILDALRQHAPFDVVSIEALQTIADSLSEMRLPDGGIALASETPVLNLYVVLDGQIDIKTSKGVATSLVPHEAFPLEVLHHSDAGKPAGCDYIAKSETHLLVIPEDTIRRLCQISQEFNEFCLSRSIFYRKRERSEQEVGGRRGGLHQALDTLMKSRITAMLAPEASVSDAIQAFHEQRTPVVAIVVAGKPIGMFTQTDLVNRVLYPKLSLATPVGRVMTPTPTLLLTTDRGFDAAVEMSRCGIRHVMVVNEEEQLAGIISDSELMDAQQGSSDLHRQITHAKTVADLARAAEKIKELAIGLTNEGIEGTQLTRVVSTLNDRMVARIVEIEAAAANISQDSFCWIALGSEGRHEQTLHTDQDNGLVFTCEETEHLEAARARMLAFSRKVNEDLDRCGLPLCSGNVMASNPECCLTPTEWRQRFSAWIETPTPEALLNASIYFDMRPLCGNKTLCSKIIDWLADEAKNHQRFFHLMTENALRRSPPIGLFRDFVVDKTDGCFDIKLNGLTMMVDGARILGLAAGCHKSGTIERFHAAGKHDIVSKADIGNWVASFKLMQGIRIQHHNAQLANGITPNNRINPYRGLNNIDRKGLLESLRHANSLQKALAAHFNLAGRV